MQRHVQASSGHLPLFSTPKWPSCLREDVIALSARPLQCVLLCLGENQANPVALDFGPQIR